MQAGWLAGWRAWRDSNPRPAANPKIGELPGARQRPAEFWRSRVRAGGGSGGGLEGDGVAEGFELADVAALAPFGVDTGGVEARAEVVKLGVGSESRCQVMTRMDRPMATMARLEPRRRAMRRYRSPRKVSVLAAPAAALPRMAAR